MDKLYCYVDESGQDTGGRIFVVAIVGRGENRDKLLDLCEQLEKVSGKRRINGEEPNTKDEYSTCASPQGKAPNYPETGLHLAVPSG